ncbi:hypothetical protein TraAM80_03296 [Trypanosoma rangeli]|uniref:Uncharacterized protein n=1 Tax=Trypanosoma rangeli TaxID=5698 RepID=A0A3R7KJ78_TRYRA|nr:uncharacterized protein TraAM80_03296 [Trypanosoma rangeli]RNF07552.1 hypothetical protein TraAM80_03296 [Trypanosoma rangeli]|eukprot:RNF07552.1 hypothetical protein TraAM80_03296 [Trypanosoma rangeli]
MKENSIRCEACGARAAVRLEGGGGAVCPSPAVRTVCYCYVCGRSLRHAGCAASASPPLTAEESSVREKARPTSAESVTFNELRALLRRRLAARRGTSLIRCAPYAATRRGPHFSSTSLSSSSSSSSSLSLLELELCDDTGRIECWRGPQAGREQRSPELLAWTASSFNGDFAEAAAAAPPWLFARLKTVEDALAEMVFDFNTRLAALQVSSIREIGGWRQQVSELRAELRERRDQETVLLRRVELLETKLRERHDVHAEEVMEEQRRQEETQRWRLRLEEKQQESLSAAYRLLCDTLGVCHVGS